MPMPTPLMLALSAAVSSIDPSVPGATPGGAPLEEDSAHWLAVASYAEAFPRALARKLAGAAPGLARGVEGGGLDAAGRVVWAQAREIRRWVGEDASTSGARRG